MASSSAIVRIVCGCGAFDLSLTHVIIQSSIWREAMHEQRKSQEEAILRMQL